MNGPLVWTLVFRLTPALFADFFHSFTSQGILVDWFGGMIDNLNVMFVLSGLTVAG